MERQTPHGVTAELHLESLARRDAGPYRCSASNDFGQDEMIVYLTVKGDHHIHRNCIFYVTIAEFHEGWTEYMAKDT
jgi:hypothetical protein